MRHLQTICLHPGLELGKVVLVVALGVPMSLLFTAWVAVTIRQYARTELQPQPPVAPTPPLQPDPQGVLGGCSCAVPRGRHPHLRPGD